MYIPGLYINETLKYSICLEKRNTVRLLKVKRNQNGTFSISKAWSLDEIREIRIVDVNKELPANRENKRHSYVIIDFRRISSRLH